MGLVADTLQVKTWTLYNANPGLITNPEWMLKSHVGKLQIDKQPATKPTQTARNAPRLRPVPWAVMRQAGLLLFMSRQERKDSSFWKNGWEETVKQQSKETRSVKSARTAFDYVWFKYKNSYTFLFILFISNIKEHQRYCFSLISWFACLNVFKSCKLREVFLTLTYQHVSVSRHIWKLRMLSQESFWPWTGSDGAAVT